MLYFFPIYIYKTKPNTHYMEMNLLTELSYHTDRVMGLALDPKKNYLYSCSTDKTFYITDLSSPKLNLLFKIKNKSS